MNRSRRWVVVVLTCAVAILAATVSAQFDKPLETGQILKPRASLDTEGSGIRGIAFSKDGKSVWTVGEQTRLWEVATGMLKMNVKYAGEGNAEWHRTAIHSVAVSPDGKMVATGDTQGLIKLWDIETAKVKQALEDEHQHVWSLAFSPDGKTLLSTGDSESRVTLWDVESGALKAKLKTPRSRCVAISPDGKTLATAMESAYQVRLWDASTGNPKKVVETRAKDGNVRAFAFSPDGKTLAMGGAVSCFLVDIATGKIRAELTHEPSDHLVDILVFSPDGRIVATVGKDAKLWDAATGKVMASLPLESVSMFRLYFQAIAFSPDGRTIATGTERGAKLWDMPAAK